MKWILSGIVLAGNLFICSRMVIAQEYLTNIQQLTFGGLNAEAYWSPDGRKLVFQATRDGRRCDQIYLLDLEQKQIRLVSTGKGVTTCGYFLPDGKHILYASTHEAGEECPPKPDRSQGYVWPVYPGYDIYVADLEGNLVARLTNEPGYDAEATVNWRTGKIVFTSLRTGDLELWVMNLDGSAKRQLTRQPGYDGGAFFSKDGQKLVWRAYRPSTAQEMQLYRRLLKRNLTSPMQMEIFVADADGRNARQLTHFGCASFAPVFTPDGERIVFSSNFEDCGSRRFELYMINLDGSGLKKITNFGGFTSFPEFSPDGRRLVFTSDWKAKRRREFNIFVADWKEP